MTEKYLLDTDLLSMRDTYAKARHWILQHYLEIALASVTIAEIKRGVELAPPGKARGKAERLLAECQAEYLVLPFDTAAALAWGEYVARAGRPLPTHDSYIAAIALANGLCVATHNKQDFPGLDTIDPLGD